MSIKHIEEIYEKNIDELLSMPIDQKKSTPFLTKYEKVKIIGLRTQQLISGAGTFLAPEEEKYAKSSRDVAKIELQLGKLQLIIVRNLPNNKKEYWRLSDLVDLDSNVD